MHTISVDIHDKIATPQGNALYVCGNSDYVIRFGFDAEWDGYDKKTARFEYGGQYQDVVFTGSDCPVPIISDVHSFNVGVYSGDLCTTTPAYIPARKSILCGAGVPADPMPDVYNQIIELLNTIAENKVTDEQVQEAVNEYLEENPIDTGVNFTTDETLSLSDDGILSVNTADDVEQDNTLPVTSAAVYVEVGNINALLETI